MLSFKPASPLSSSTLIQRVFSSSSLCALRGASSAHLRWLVSLWRPREEGDPKRVDTCEHATDALCCTAGPITRLESSCELFLKWKSRRKQRSHALDVSARAVPLGGDRRRTDGAGRGPPLAPPRASGPSWRIKESRLLAPRSLRPPPGSVPGESEGPEGWRLPEEPETRRSAEPWPSN